MSVQAARHTSRILSALVRAGPRAASAGVGREAAGDEENREERARLQRELGAGKPHLATGDAITEATGDLEPPFISLSIYAKRLLETVAPEGQIPPVVSVLAKHIAETVRAMDGLFKQIRDMRKGKRG